LVPRRIDDFAEMCRYHQRSPQSHFTQGTVCSIATATGRITISGDRLIETDEGHRTERLIQNEAELRTLLGKHFRVTNIDRDLLPKRDAAAPGQAEYAIQNQGYRLAPRSIAAVAPIHFTFGWGYALLAGTRVQKERYSRKCEKPWQQFSIHYRRQYCAEH
jgi:hypothetical protein